MTNKSANPLIDCGKPLFFPVADSASTGFGAPPIRLGDAVRLAVRSLSVMQKEALVTSARSGKTWRLASDEGAYLGGLDAAPCPLAFLTTGMVSASMNEVLALASQRGIRIDAIRLVQDNYYTMTGSARAGTMTGGARDVRLTAQIASSTDRETLQKLVLDATIASPLNGLMRNAMESLFTLTHNGAPIAPGAALPLERPSQPDPGELFDRATPETGDWSGIIRRGDMTPRAEHTVTLANDSLSDQQDRLLHVRGICTLRGDGVKQIEQQLFNPHGSIFHFLCDEAPEAGGRGLAPDAVSYISAGIGFCFMTQFGRYAKIVGKDLRAYRITQDTHFSLGGASGGTGEAGRAEPVETHVHLETGENDAFARKALDMAVQTCFLHAFCKAELRAHVKIQDYDDSGGLPPAVSS